MDEQFGGPYLAVATFCENVIEDKQGTLSLIRLIDRMTLTTSGPDAPEKMPPVPLRTTMVLAFKSGFAKGSHRVRVEPTNPDGQPLPEVTLPMQLEGDDRGANLILGASTLGSSCSIHLAKARCSCSAHSQASLVQKSTVRVGTYVA